MTISVENMLSLEEIESLVPKLKGVLSSLDTTISAKLCISRKQNLVKAREEALEFALSLLHQDHDDVDAHFVFTGNSAWQKRNRVVRYYRLWRSLEINGVELKGRIEPVVETFIENDNGIKFFGIGRILDNSISAVVEILSIDKCTYVFLLDDKDLMSPENLRDHLLIEDPLSALIKVILKKNGSILISIGEFDDVDKGFLIISS